MMHQADDPNIRKYLHELDARLRHLPAEQSEEILQGITDHISDALSRGSSSVADVPGSLGTPEEVARGAAAERVPTATPPWRESTPWVVLTTLLLVFGGFIAGFGWFLGLAGLWMGTRWKLWEKIVGTVVLPGGLAGAVTILVVPVSYTSLTSESVTLTPDSSMASGAEVLGPVLSIIATIATLALPLIVGIYLLIVGLRREQTTMRAAQLTA